MAQCDVCGNHYDKTMEIRLRGKTGTYDCFECAIYALAPSCAHCGCRVIGHGVEAKGKIFIRPDESGPIELRMRAKDRAGNVGETSVEVPGT